jgi:DNA-binding MarR family transcriptional regulator/N-acetylglutamate synthase-like GNAT family acetyltransferase
MKRKDDRIETLRNCSRKLIRELGMLQLNKGNNKVTPGHWHALIEVSREPGIAILKLGSLLLMSTSTISRLVKSLAKDGFLIITVGRDKREKHLYLTDMGQAEIKKIDDFSESKINRSFEFLTDEEIELIIQSISKYCNALEVSREIREQIKIMTISTSRTIRKQLINMIENIQKNEFSIPITDEINMCILKAEEEFYYNNSYNFWYATDNNGTIIGSIGLKKINDRCGEIKKFFVVKEYRGKGVGQKLMEILLKAVLKHKFDVLVLGTVDKLHAAQKFYIKQGFTQIDQEDLPLGFEKCPVDTIFFRGNVKDISSSEAVKK